VDGDETGDAGPSLEGRIKRHPVVAVVLVAGAVATAVGAIWTLVDRVLPDNEPDEAVVAACTSAVSKAAAEFNALDVDSVAQDWDRLLSAAKELTIAAGKTRDDDLVAAANAYQGQVEAYRRLATNGQPVPPAAFFGTDLAAYGAACRRHGVDVPQFGPLNVRDADPNDLAACVRVSAAVVYAAVVDPEHSAEMNLGHLATGLELSHREIAAAGEDATSSQIRRAIGALLTPQEGTSEELEAKYRELVEACVAADVPRESADALELTR
jgi:hypothetical protein